MPDQQVPTEGAPVTGYQALERELRALRTELEAGIDHRDHEHMRKMERWGRLCTLGGYATAWIAPNPLSAFLISLGNTARWTIVTHHVSHRSMDRVPGAPERYGSKVFAKGTRRFVDWLDWILPEAWHHEHDVLHHYYTGEIDDPDLVEETAADLRNPSLPLPLRYLTVGLYACTWKLIYYAPSTFRALKRSLDATAGDAPQGGKLDLFNPLHAEGREFWRRCVLPYAAFRFAALPALFLPLGPIAVANVLANSVAAEVLTNLHTFLIIVPNHAGSDLYRFEGRAVGRAERYLRQIAGSCNYTTGGDLNDFLHGFLNYQIEHHLFPELPPLKLRQIQPRVKALCEKHGIPYVQESVFRRVAKLVDIMVGKTSMRRMDTRDARPARTPAGAEATAT